MKLHCPTSDALSKFEDAVNKGYIGNLLQNCPYFHASLARRSLQRWKWNYVSRFISIWNQYLSWIGILDSIFIKNQDSKFGKNLTFTMSQRDVPGLTRAVIPLLNASGVQVLYNFIYLWFKVSRHSRLESTDSLHLQLFRKHFYGKTKHQKLKSLQCSIHMDMEESLEKMQWSSQDFPMLWFLLLTEIMLVPKLGRRFSIYR